MLRIKNGKGLDASDNLYHRVPRNILQYYSNKEKHKTEDTVDRTELHISEARPDNKSSPFRLNNGTVADFNFSFENDPDPEIEKINQDYRKNNKQEYKVKEENEVVKNGKGKGHPAEDASHSSRTDPEESPGKEQDSATVAAAVNQRAEEAAPANAEAGGPAQPGRDGPQVGVHGSPLFL